MKRKMFRVTSIVLASSLVFGLAACGTGSSSSNETAVSSTVNSSAGKSSDVKPITLKSWNIWVNDTDVRKIQYTEIVNEYETKFPHIKIETEAVENETYKTKLKTSIAAAEVPDVFFTWTAGFGKPFVDAGKVLCLDDYYKKDGMGDKYINEGILSNAKYDGKLYAFPFAMNMAVLYCNKEMFDTNGIKIPDTYDELIAAVKAFRAKGIGPITIAEKERWPGIHWYDSLALRTAGVQNCIDTLSKKASFEQPEFIDAAAKLDELVKEKAFVDGAMGLSFDEAEQMFLLGKAPMYYMGDWSASGVDGENSKVRGKVVVKNFPMVTGGKGDPNDFFGGSGDGFMVSAEIQDKDAAVGFAEYLAEGMSAKGYRDGSNLPPFKVSGESKMNPTMAQIKDLAANTKGSIIWWDVFLEGADADTHKNLVAEVFAGKLTPQDYAKEMQKLNQK